MSKTRQHTPSYRHYKPKDLAVVRIDGRDHYLGRFDSPTSWERYHRLIAEWLANRQYRAANSTDPSRSPRLTINAFILLYWRFAESYYVKDGTPTDETYGIRSALRPLRKLYGETPADEFGPLALKAVRESMIEHNLSRGVINQHVGRIKRMFRWGVENELIPVAVHQALQTVVGLRKGRTLAREMPPVLPVPEADVKAVLLELSDVLQSMVRFQLLTGCRPGEICRIRPGDVNRTGDVWCYVPGRHKTEHHDRQRRIFIGPEAQQVLRPYLERNDDAYCFSPRESVSPHRKHACAEKKPVQRVGRLPKRQRRDRYSVDSYRRAISRVCQRAGIETWSPNQLRHTRATELRRKFGLEAVQTVLGHSKADVTQMYAERDFRVAE